MSNIEKCTGLTWIAGDNVVQLVVTNRSLGSGEGTYVLQGSSVSSSNQKQKQNTYYIMSSLTFECHMTFISADSPIHCFTRNRNNMKLRI